MLESIKMAKSSWELNSRRTNFRNLPYTIRVHKGATKIGAHYTSKSRWTPTKWLKGSWQTLGLTTGSLNNHGIYNLYHVSVSAMVKLFEKSLKMIGYSQHLRRQQTESREECRKLHHICCQQRLPSSSMKELQEVLIEPNTIFSGNRTVGQNHCREHSVQSSVRGIYQDLFSRSN